MARFHFYHLLLLFSLVLPLYGADPIGDYCNNDKRLTNAQKSNVDGVLAQLVAKAPLDGFATASSGSGANGVYGLVQCRQDVSTEDCSTCTHDAAKEIQKRCPDQVDARIWYDYCFLRYDTDNFIGKLDAGYGIIYYNVENITGDVESFKKKVGDLMNRVEKQAIALPMSRGLGKDKTDFSPFVTIYGLAQCTRDLSQLSCAQCLAIAIGNFPKYCQDSKGCQVNYSSCRARYEIYPFFFPVDSKNKALVAKGSALRVLLYP
ncbi:hypothetical protein AAC387_Pa02g4943 [Persea americana]